MASKKSGRGLSSSAGLVTYYDADNRTAIHRTAIHISPKTVLIVVAVVGVAIYLLNLFF